MASHFLLRVPTLEQSQLAQTLHERLISKPGKNFPLSSTASFAEDLSISANRMNYKKCEDLEIANASESIHDISSDSRTSQMLYSERRLSETSVTDTDCKKSAKPSLQRKAVNCCECDQVSRMIAEGFSAPSKVSSQSLNFCHGCRDMVCITDRQDYSSLPTVDEMLMTNKEETNIFQNGHSALPLDSQLAENDGVSRFSIMRVLPLNMNPNK